jgi:hypothetical protein
MTQRIGERAEMGLSARGGRRPRRRASAISAALGVVGEIRS